METEGPPVVMHLNHLKLGKSEFRATAVTVFFVFHFLPLVTYSIPDLIDLDMLQQV
ncbi:MAG: hypothetical protein GXO64_02180 [Candidatus Micrarchaeota archaeon]|nr:hypothetical protein [Candidatus Micrarchaeota archaeon]